MLGPAMFVQLQDDRALKPSSFRPQACSFQGWMSKAHIERLFQKELTQVLVAA